MRHLRREAFEAVHLVEHGAEVDLERQGFQAGQKRAQRLLRILAVEIFGVGKPRPQHVLVAGGHGVEVLRVAVAHADEVRQQAAVCGVDREVALVLLHDRHQHFGGQFQEARPRSARRTASGVRRDGSLRPANPASSRHTPPCCAASSAAASRISERRVSGSVTTPFCCMTDA